MRWWRRPVGVVAIDGKTLPAIVRPGSHRAAGRSTPQVVTAFAAEAQLVISQKAVPAGGNEITAARELLQLLDLKGTLVTTNAIHCQHDTAALVLARGGDDLLALRDNRPTMQAEVEAFFADPQGEGIARHETINATTAGPKSASARSAMTSAGSHRTAALPAKRPCPASPPSPCSKPPSSATAGPAARAASLSSRPLTAERFAEAARAHWRIENGVHGVLDTAFDEDRARKRKDYSAENLAVIRKRALNVFKRARPDMSISRKRKRSGWSDAFARSILGQVP